MAMNISRLSLKRLVSLSNQSKGVAIGSIALILAACGGETTENITNINQMSMDVVSSVGDLPKCTGDNEGEQAFVKGETSARICVDGKWLSLSAGDNATIECSTKPLADKSGLKIVCNGDSIGVVLNGSDGKDGLDGKDGENGKDGEPGTAGKDGLDGKDGDDGVGCSIASQTDSTVTVKCGSGSFTMNLNGGSAASIIDTGDVTYEIENASFSGVSQKGPFVKGATVTAFELDGSKSLLQTGRTFSGTISQDDGRFNMKNVTLKSSYVRLSANGYYRNEVTGERSASPITLNAITDLDARNTVNVNLLTHLEYDRVAYLMAQGDGTLKIKTLKKQAENEIFKVFHIDATGFGYSEDLDVFGNTEADAALLAISILLQGDRGEAELTELLTSFSTDFSTDSSWDDLAKRAEIADSALSKDEQGQLAIYRANVKDWGLSTGDIPDFEKYIRRFYGTELGLGVCGSSSTPLGTVKNVSNPKSMYYAERYHDTTGTGGKIRFICADVDGPKWQFASDLEKDRFDWDPPNKKDGSLLDGPVTGKKMVWDADTLRYASGEVEINGDKGCTSYNQEDGKLYILKNYYSYYRCTKSGWEFALDTLNRGTLEYEGKTYKTIGIKTQMWMAENLNYEVGNSFCYGDSDDNCAKYGRLYTWATAVGKTEEECGYQKNCVLPDTVQGICPEGWHLPDSSEWKKLYAAVDSNSHAIQATGFAGWEHATDDYGFSALPAGIYGTEERGFAQIGSWARFWSSKAQSIHNGFHFDLYPGSMFHTNNHDKRDRYSVRCVMNKKY